MAFHETQLYAIRTLTIEAVDIECGQQIGTQAVAVAVFEKKNWETSNAKNLFQVKMAMQGCQLLSG